MKKLILVVLALSFSLSVSAQTEDVSGTYRQHIKFRSRIGINTLTLNADGTFKFQNYSTKADCDTCHKDINYGRGSWQLIKDNVVVLSVNEATDMDDTYWLDFDKAKAKISTTSDAETKLKFFEGDIIPFTDMEMIKVE